MKKSILLLFFIYLIHFPNYSQELIFESPVNFANEGTTFKIFDEKSQGFILLIEGKLELSGFYFSKDIEEELIFTIKRTDEMQDRLLGGIVNEFDLVLFFTNKKFTELHSLVYNIKTRQGAYTTIDYRPEKEKIVAFWSHNFKFNILSIKKNTSILNVHEFTFPDSHTIKEFDCSGYRYSMDPTFNKLYYVLKPLGFELIPITKANFSLAEASKTVKIYIQDEKIILISEKIPHTTLALEIDLLKNSSNGKGFTFPLLNSKGQFDSKSCSYLLDSILYQFNICKHRFVLSISNFESQIEIDRILVSDSANISIANSPIIFEKQDQMMLGDRNKNIENN